MKTIYAQADARRRRSAVLSCGLSIGVTAALFLAVPLANMLSVAGEKKEPDITGGPPLPPPPPPPLVEPPPPPPNVQKEKPKLRPDVPKIELIPTAAAIDVGGDFPMPTGFVEFPPAVDPAIWEVDALDKAPVPRQQVAPEYPYEARQNGINGWVEVEFVVDERGRVVYPRVRRSSDRIFERAALDAIRMWHFEPGEKDGRAVMTRMLIPFRFNVSGRDQ